jgi:hypothetical protein
MRIPSQDADRKWEQRLSAALQWNSTVAKQVWRFDQNGIGQPA